MKIIWIYLISSLCIAVARPLLAGPIQLDKIKLPPGFKMSVFNEHVPGARSMSYSSKGTLFVGTMEQGKVYAIKDDKVYVIAEGLSMPNGVAFHNGSLYVAETSRIIRFDQIEIQLNSAFKPPAKYVVVSDAFPKNENHMWKVMRFSPDGWLYVSVGAPCDSCKKDDPRFGSIMRMKPDGKDLEVFAAGVRNSIGFDWDPDSRDLWFTDNGRDRLGDEVPADKLNHASKPKMNFGFPYCHGGDIPDSTFGKEKPCSEFTPPAQKLPAHVAPLGMRFYSKNLFPKEFQNQIFIAEHGSWNRTKKIGYRVTMVSLKNSKVVGYRDFATGWLQGESAWGRPVDIELLPSGEMLISDDEAGAIYKITYHKLH